MGLAVGIDLGTTNSVVAISQSGRPRVLETAGGSPLIPSIVSFHPNGQTIVGAAARERRAIDPTNTVFSVKRLLGRPFQSEEVRRAKARFAFELREGPDAAVLVHTRNGDLSLPEISALVLREIRRIAEAALENTVDRAVVTVPANFNELQRTATKVAGQIADLDVIRILNEPTAAALAYGYGRGARERVAVYDFGGGTFDVTLLELSGNVFEVLATAGDTFLGGDDIDLLVAENLADALLQAHRIDARQDPRAYELLRAAAEQAKMDLSTMEQATIRIPEIGYAPGGRALEFRTRITRVELEALAAPLVSRTFDVCTEALKLASMRPADCSTVILVGGSSRIPAVRAGVASYFGRDPLMTLAPEQVVGMGAAILAEALTGGRRQTATGASRPRTQSVRPPAAGPSEPGRSQPPPPITQPMGMQRATAGASQRVPTTPPRGASPRATSGPAIRPRPTDEFTTAAVLQTRPRISTNPGIPGATLPGDLTWGQSKPPEADDDGEATRLMRMPSTSPLPAFGATDPSLFDSEPTTSPGSAPAMVREPPRAESPAAPPLPPSLPPMPQPPPVAERAPGPPPFSPHAVGVRTAVMLAAVPPPPQSFELPASPPVASPGAQAFAPSVTAAAPGTSARAPSGFGSLPSFTAPDHAPAGAPSGGRPGQPAAPGLPSGSGTGSMRAAMPNVAARPPSLPPGHFGLPSIPPPQLPLLLDVTPHTLGLETVGGMCETVIARNATIPVEQTREFATSYDDQESVKIRISQGESRRFGENQALGELELSGLPRGPRGEVKVSVTFELDADGTLQVRARDPVSGRETRTRVTLLTMPTAGAMAAMTQRQRNQA